MWTRRRGIRTAGEAAALLALVLAFILLFVLRPLDCPCRGYSSVIDVDTEDVYAGRFTFCRTCEGAGAVSIANRLWHGKPRATVEISAPPGPNE